MADQREQATAPDRVARVCVVDDDDGVRESLRFFFEDAGYEVAEAQDGGAALALLRADARPWVVLLDRMMPRLDGVRTLRLLDDEPALARQLAIVFMSARSDLPVPEDVEVIQRATFATVPKPFNLDVLLATVDRASMHLAERVAAG